MRDWMTAKEVATLLRVSRPRVSQLRTLGKLIAADAGDGLKFDRQHTEAYARERFALLQATEEDRERYRADAEALARKAQRKRETELAAKAERQTKMDALFERMVIALERIAKCSR